MNRLLAIACFALLGLTTSAQAMIQPEFRDGAACSIVSSAPDSAGPSSVSLVLSCRNNPIDLTDPLGLMGRNAVSMNSSYRDVNKNMVKLDFEYRSASALPCTIPYSKHESVRVTVPPPVTVSPPVKEPPVLRARHDWEKHVEAPQLAPWTKKVMNLSPIAIENFVPFDAAGRVILAFRLGEKENAAKLTGLLIAGTFIDTALLVGGGPQGKAVASVLEKRIAATVEKEVVSVLETGAARSAGAAGDEMVTVYRGVGGEHPGFQNAVQGKAIPRGGHADPVLHNEWDTRSVFTSWSTDYQSAVNFALQDGPGGVVLKQTVPRSSLVTSPDVFKEFEVLRVGPVEGATPIILSP